MPTHYCVPECTKKGYREDGTKASFFKFPIQNQMKKKWLHAIRREEGKYFKVTKSTRVYSRHFRKGDIKKIPFWEKWTKTRSCSLCFSVDSNIATQKKGAYGKILWRDRFEKCIKCVFFSCCHGRTIKWNGTRCIGFKLKIWKRRNTNWFDRARSLLDGNHWQQ